MKRSVTLALFWGLAACGSSGGGDEPDATACGDGVAGGLEFCDGTDLRGESCTSLNLQAGTLACGSDCRYDFSGCMVQPSCGNGVREGSEECDDGNNVDNDTCAADCTVEVPSTCGDGNLDVVNNEECDDNNTSNGDGCNSACQLEPVGQACDNGQLDPLEKCDPPEVMPADGDGCNATCNLSGAVTTLNPSVQADSITSDNTYLWLGIHDCAAQSCGIARIDIAACIAAPGTAACNPTFVVGGGSANCVCATGSCSGGNLVPAPAVTDGDSSTATFDFIGSMATDGTKIWIGHQNVLREIDIAGATTTTVAGVNGSCAAIDGNGTSALFHGIRGLTYWNGRVYLLDGCEDVLRTYDPSSGDVTTIAGTRQPDPRVTQSPPYTCPPPCQFSNACGPASTPTPGIGTNAVFVSPRYMAADHIGNLFIIDTNGQAIWEYNTATTQADILIAGTSGGLPNPYTDGSAALSTIGRPRGIISDGTSIYFAEQNYGTLRQVELSSNMTTTFVGTAGCVAGGNTTVRDGLGADTTQVWFDPNNSRCVASPPSGTPIFNTMLGAMTFSFANQSIFMVDGGVLRRIE